MKIPTFKQFQDLLVPEAKNSVLFSAVQPQIISFRQNTLSAMAAEAAYEKIFDKADGTSGTTRQQHSPRDGGKPNTSRLESIKRGRGDRLTVEAVYYHFQFGEEDTGYADAISRELFEESTFYQHFEDKLRRMGLDTPAQGDGHDAFQFGNVKLCLAYESGMKSLDFPERDTEALFENGNLLPLEALHWRNGVSRIYGRSQEIADIKEWAEDPDPRCKIHLIHGPGGVGKTRLAAEAVLQLKKLGWKVGFLPGDIRDPNTSVKLACGGVGALLIIDYPEERPKLVQAIFAALAGDQHYRVPVRILLVSRETEPAWRDSTNNPIRRLSATSLELLGRLDVDDAYELLESAVEFLTALSEIDEMDVSTARNWLASNSENRLPLYTLAAVIHAVTSPENAFKLGGREVIKALVDIELSRVRRYSARNFAVSDFQDNSDALEKLIALGLLSGKGVSKDALYCLGDKDAVPGLTGHNLLQRVARTPFWKRDSDLPDGGFLDKIEPDILAGAFLKEALLKGPQPRELSAWMACTSSEAGNGFLGVLSRLIFDVSQFDAEASRALEAHAIDMLDVAPALVVEFVQLQWERGTVFSVAFSVRLLEMMLRIEASLEVRSGIFNNMAIMLCDLERHEEALEAAQEASRINRALAEAQPNGYLPKLAKSLNTLATTLRALGRREEALAAAQETADLNRRLARSKPDEFRKYLASSLNNLATMLSDLGRREEALAVGQESTDLCRSLAETRPEAFQPDLAASLKNLSIVLAHLGRWEEALAAAQESNYLYRRLAETLPDIFRPHLAMSGDNLASRLFESGWLDDGLAVAQEANAQIRKLAASRPNAFRPDLAASLNNLAAILSARGRQEKALAVTREAADHYRVLAKSRPDTFQPDLAFCLVNLADKLSEFGWQEEAFTIAQEALNLYRRLSGTQPNANLARCLRTMAQVLSRLGRQEEALAVAQSTAYLYRRLAEAHPDTFRPDLAISLKTLANSLSELSRREEALETAKEAVLLLRPFFLGRPHAYRRRMGLMCAFYVQLYRELDAELDAALLQPINEMFERMKRGEV